MEIYNAIYSYVQKYLALYYLSDDDVKKDLEIQNWRQELVAPTKDNGLGMEGVFGEKGKFTTREQVCLTLTSVIFTCSVQHAAANFRQYEDYAYPPCNPLKLHGGPPNNKQDVEEADFMQALPTKAELYSTLVITSALSTNATNSLGDFEVEYITDDKALKVVEEFKADLARIAINNKEKNKNRPDKYWCLNPYRVPNSISI
jgi:arachidonate 5-lipoxygenase